MNRPTVQYAVSPDGTITHEDDFATLSDHDRECATWIEVDEYEANRYADTPEQMYAFLRGVINGYFSCSKVRW